MTHPQTAALIALLERVEAGHLTASCLPDSMVKNWQQIMDAYHGSLDAAKALHDAVLPGWSPSVGQNAHHGYWFAHVLKSEDGSIVGDKDGSSPDTPARAWLIAIIRALIADTEGR